MSVTPLRMGVDTLEFTFDGELASDFLDYLEDLKDRAQALDDPQPLFLMGRMWHIGPQATKHYRYELRDGDMIVWLRRKGPIPLMKVKCLSEALVGLGHERLYEKASELAVSFGLEPKRISRVDVCLDFQGWAPTLEEFRAVACRAQERVVMPNLDEPGSYRFGRGDVLVRVYNKTKEIAHSKKAWMVQVWGLNPHYAVEEDVWRVEVQLRGTGLEQLQAKRAADCFSKLHGLFDYGMRWCSWRVPTADSNRSRWPEHPDWETLRRYADVAEPVGRLHAGLVIVYMDLLAKRHLSNLVTAGAHMSCENLNEVNEALFNEIRNLLRDRDQRFPELVQSKRRKMLF